MSTFRSSLNSINNATLLTARHNDTHSNDAINLLFTDIYTAVPNAVIVDFGVNYRVATSDFQAWATYYNPDAIYNPAAPDNLEIISQYQPINTWAYTGTFEIYNDVDLGGAFSPGDYFCLKTVDYNSPIVLDVTAVTPPPAVFQLDSSVITPIAGNNNQVFTLYWQVAGVQYSTNFDAVTGSGNIICTSQSVPVDVCVMLPQGGVITGDAIPAHGTTGRYGILLTQYTI